MARCQVFVTFVLLIISDLKLSEGQLPVQGVNRSWKRNKIFEYHPVPHPFLPDEARHHQPRFRSRPTKFQNYRYPTRRTKYKSLPFEDIPPPPRWNGYASVNSHWASNTMDHGFGHGKVDSHWASATTNNEFVIGTTCNENEPCHTSKETSKEVIEVPENASDEVMIPSPGVDSDENEIQDSSHMNKSSLKKLFQFAMPLLVGLCAWLATLMMMSSAMTSKPTSETFTSSEEMISNTPGIHLHMDTESEETVTEFSLADELAQEEKEKDKKHEKLLKKLDVTDQVLSIVERGLLLAVRKVELLSVITGYGQQLGSSAGTGPPGGPAALSSGLPNLLEGALSLLPNLTAARNEALQELIKLEANSTEVEVDARSTELPVSNSTSVEEITPSPEPVTEQQPNITVKPYYYPKSKPSSGVQVGYLNNPYISNQHIRIKRPNSYNRNKPYLYEFMESTTTLAPYQIVSKSTTIAPRIKSAPHGILNKLTTSAPRHSAPRRTYVKSTKSTTTTTTTTTSKPKRLKCAEKPRPSTSEGEAFDFAVPVS